MPIPYFTKDDNLTAFKKMKVIFLVKQIRLIDICLLVAGIFPFLLNLVIFGLIAGSNDIWKFFCPFGSFFKAPSSIVESEWPTWYGTLHMCSIGGAILARIWFSWKLFNKMLDFKKKRPYFVWDRKDKFWLVVFLPFISFVVYPILVKMTKFELSHKYNL